MNVQNRINCRKCKYYYITWEKNQPHGCKAMAFKSYELPNLVVYKASGQECLKFQPKVVKPNR